jgi:arsenate reductase (thioredoxin)
MNILFICTHNRCRSILSEAITNHLGEGKLRAFSAGSQPAGQVHPLSLKYLKQQGIPTEGLISQSWDDFDPETSKIKINLVITVCDQAANEVCPVWFAGNSDSSKGERSVQKIHWGLPDPSKLQGSEAEVEAAFNAVIDTIKERVKTLLALDLNAETSIKEQLNLLSEEN